MALDWRFALDWPPTALELQQRELRRRCKETVLHLRGLGPPPSGPSAGSPLSTLTADPQLQAQQQQPGSLSTPEPHPWPILNRPPGFWLPQAAALAFKVDLPPPPPPVVPRPERARPPPSMYAYVQPRRAFRAHLSARGDPAQQMQPWSERQLLRQVQRAQPSLKAA